MGSVLITGANGFVGRSLCEFIAERHRLFRPAVRFGGGPIGRAVPCFVGEVGANTDWSAALAGVGEVVHLASRVHVMRENGADVAAIYREVNTTGTLNLAHQAAAAGVRRFVFVSSVKVNGEERGEAYSEKDRPNPVGPYAISKWDAELGLWEIADRSGMEVVVIRPPLVYGPGVKANLLSMIRWLSRGVPLPFGAIHNQRSLVGLGNLVDFIATCVDHASAANQVFLVSDGEDLSTTELLTRMATAVGIQARLIPVPAWMLTAGASLLGKRDLSQRLCGSLRVDISKARNLLGWSPPVSVDEGLRRTAEHYRKGA